MTAGVVDGAVGMGPDLDVRAFLVTRGVSAEDVGEAAVQGTLPLLALDVLVFPERPRYDEASLVDQVGVDAEYARALWRAMGFPMVPAGEVAFYEDDLAALPGAVVEGVSEGFVSADRTGAAIVHQTRVMSAALARIAEQSTDDIVNVLSILRTEGRSEEDIARTMITSFDMDQFERLLWYLFRRQWRAAAWRRLAQPTDAATLVTVGFVDLVRFAAITEQIADEELEQLVVRFEEVAHNTIAEGGGRVVKMIGDAVMFVADDPEHAVRIALRLVDAYADDPWLPPACGARARTGPGPRRRLLRTHRQPRGADRRRRTSVPCRCLRRTARHARHLGPVRVSHRLPPKRLKGIGRVSLWAAQLPAKIPSSD